MNQPKVKAKAKKPAKEEEKEMLPEGEVKKRDRKAAEKALEHEK
jgi:hypothetical protein